jgi:DNA-binding transcriptional LysR family regulator
MHMNEFVIFTAVASHLNVSKAAKEVHLSQPAVSQLLKRLEKSYQLKLYRKRNWGVELTKEGETFRKYSKMMLSDLEALKSELSNGRSNGTVGSFLIGGSYGPSAARLPRLLSLFQKSHPLTRITLRTRNNRTIERMVLDSKVEIGVISGPPRSAQLATEPCSSWQKVVAFVSVHSPLARKLKMTLPEFLMSPLVILGGREGRGRIEETLWGGMQTERLKPNIVMRCESPEAVKSAVEAGMGVGVTYRSLVDRELKAGRFKTLKIPGWQISLRRFAVYRKDRPLSAVASEFLDLLRRNQRALKDRSTGRQVEPKRIRHEMAERLPG